MIKPALKSLRVARSYVGMKLQKAGAYGLKARAFENRLRRGRTAQAQQGGQKRGQEPTPSKTQGAPMQQGAPQGKPTVGNDESPMTGHFVAAPQVNVGKGTVSDGSSAAQARPLAKPRLTHGLDMNMVPHPTDDFGKESG